MTPPPTPDPDERWLHLLAAYADGELDDASRLRVERWLAEHPSERARLVADRKLLDPATEEFLRYFTPAQGDARTVTKDCEVAGYQFAQGDRVLMGYAMPNRDPRVFANPDELQLDRFPNRHAAFGLGNHRCIGG